jgi:hypothetical protein
MTMQHQWLGESSKMLFDGEMELYPGEKESLYSKFSILQTMLQKVNATQSEVYQIASNALMNPTLDNLRAAEDCLDQKDLFRDLPTMMSSGQSA